MNTESFEQIAQRVVSAGRKSGGIGTLGEKTLHTVLKYYLEPDSAWHEVRVGPFVADILGRDGILEIQTRNFWNLRKKLAYFLPEHPVTVVYPAVRQKWLRWVDPETGEVTKRRKSPKTGTPAEIFSELSRIRPLLFERNLSLRILLIDVEETRFLNGWSDDRKRGSARYDRIPLALCGDITISSPSGYARLLPPGLPSPFTTKDFGRLASLSLHAAQNAVHILTLAGVLRCTGKAGRMNLYEIIEPDDRD